MAKFGNQGLDHIAIAVSDVERSQRFYAEILGFERAHQEWDVPVVMAANGTGVAVHEPMSG
jgi:catechol 2,3-dioxygenase-like lactoylglutathione lyase family enzyme